MTSKLFVLFALIAVEADEAKAQTVAPMRQSVLYQAQAVGVEAEAVRSDSISQKQRIGAAVGFAVLGGLIGMIVTADADGAPHGSLPVILLLAGAGAVAGYVTGGKSTN